MAAGKGGPKEIKQGNLIVAGTQAQYGAQAPGMPAAGTVQGRVGRRPDYVGTQHSMTPSGGPKARNTPGLGDVMRDLALRGGMKDDKQEGKKAEQEHVRQYNATHRQGTAQAVRRMAHDARAGRADAQADDLYGKKKSISSRSMQLADKKGGKAPDRDAIVAAGGDARSIEDAEEAVDMMQGGRSGMADLLAARARKDAKKRQQV